MTLVFSDLLEFNLIGNDCYQYFDYNVIAIIELSNWDKCVTWSSYVGVLLYAVPEILMDLFPNVCLSNSNYFSKFGLGMFDNLSSNDLPFKRCLLIVHSILNVQ